MQLVLSQVVSWVFFFDSFDKGLYGINQPTVMCIYIYIYIYYTYVWLYQPIVRIVVDGIYDNIIYNILVVIYDIVYIITTFNVIHYVYVILLYMI